MSTIPPPSRRSEAGSARPLLVLLLAVVSFAAGAATMLWWVERSKPLPARPDYSALTPSPLTGSAETAPSAAPSPEATPSPGASAEPSPAPSAAAEAATPAPPRRVARNAAPAANPVVPLPPRKLPPPPAEATRSFVLGTTVVESLRPVGKLTGFETEGVGVKRAPTVDGRVELVVDPAQIKPGDAYTIKVFLRNDGRKTIEVGEMKVSLIVDGKSSTRPLPAKVRSVAPNQRALLEELPGVWTGGVNDWAVEAVVTSKGQDVYRNRLTWK